MLTLVVDVSSVTEVSRHHGLTGVDRVMIGALEAVERSARVRVELCRFDRRSRRYVLVAPDEFRAAAVSATIGRPGAGLVRGDSGTSTARVRRRRTAAWDALGERRPGTERHARRLVELVKVWLRCSAAVVREAEDLARVGWAERRANQTRHCRSNAWDSSTTYLNLGLNAASNDLAYLSDRRNERGFAVVLTVHDLIGVVAPQYLADNSSTHEAELGIADAMLAVSDATGSDLAAFADSCGRALPPVVKLPMTSTLVGEQPVEPDFPADIRTALSHGFVLCVGSVSSRKNHHLLLDVWEQLAADGAADVPGLVVVGRRGWLAEETMARLERTPALHGVVHHLADAGDGELAWLYRNSRFTVFPSRHEGWGLPVTESHAFGKVCLAADATSVPEAGAGLAILLDPIDRAAWREEVIRYWSDDALRMSVERTIANEFRLPTGDDVAAAIHEVCNTARANRTGVRGAEILSMGHANPARPS